MSDIHNSIKYGSVLSGIARIAGLGENEEGVNRLSETLQPILELERSDKQWPQGWTRAMGLASLVAGAAVSSATLFNPDLDKNLFLFECYLKAANAGASTIQVIWFRVDVEPGLGMSPVGSQSANTSLLDTRPTKKLPQGQVWSSSAVAPATNTAFYSRRLAIEQESEWIGPFDIGGRNQFGMRTSAASDVLFTFKWRERQLLRGELRP